MHYFSWHALGFEHLLSKKGGAIRLSVQCEGPMWLLGGRLVSYGGPIPLSMAITSYTSNIRQHDIGTRNDSGLHTWRSMGSCEWNCKCATGCNYS